MDRPSELPRIKPPDTTVGLTDIPIKPPGQTTGRKPLQIGWGTSGAAKTGQDIKDEFALQAAREQTQGSIGKIVGGSEVNQGKAFMKQKADFLRSVATVLDRKPDALTLMTRDELLGLLHSKAPYLEEQLRANPDLF